MRDFDFFQSLWVRRKPVFDGSVSPILVSDDSQFIMTDDTGQIILTSDVVDYVNLYRWI